MKSILLTPAIEDMSNEYSLELFLDRKDEFLQPLPNLRALLNGLDNAATIRTGYKKYIITVIRVYPFINRLKPSFIDRVHQLFANLDVDLSEKININGKDLPFYKHVTAAMRYDAVRDKDFLPYAKKLGIRSCVYCNANYAISFKVKKSNIAKYELDHFKPQSVYPYLCTNFYNLYPVCANCNKAKLKTITLFPLYTEDPARRYPFKFTLDKKSIVKYMLTQDYTDLKIEFDTSDHDDHNRVFKIEGSYNALKDVAEELIWKHKIYNSSYLKSLRESFGKKFNYGGFNRLILGNYDKPTDIHQRPLSKLTQDIAKQLGILK